MPTFHDDLLCAALSRERVLSTRCAVSGACRIREFAGFACTAGGRPCRGFVSSRRASCARLMITSIPGIANALRASSLCARGAWALVANYCCRGCGVLSCWAIDTWPGTLTDFVLARRAGGTMTPSTSVSSLAITRYTSSNRTRVCRA